MLIEVGADAPDFTLKTSENEDFRLSDLRGVLRAMLVFYPKDFTPGCTDQLNAINRSIHAIRRAGIEPMGVNPDDAESHEKFREAHEFNFALLVDEDAEVARAYGAVKEDGESIQRSVVLVDKDGTVMFAEQGAPPWQRMMNVVKAADRAAAS